MDAPGCLGKWPGVPGNRFVRCGGRWPLALDARECYIITLPDLVQPRVLESMPTHIHSHPHHHHHPGAGHPPASISPSILRLSVVERLAIAAVLIAVVWGAVFWAMSSVTA